MRSKYLHSASLLPLSLMAGVLAYGSANANPADGVVSAGAATIIETGPKLDIHQSTDKAVIDWRTFNIAPGEHTQFHQPSSSSMTLNRVSAGNPSEILGRLSANGNIVILNPSGVLFGAGSQVDVGGLIATTSGISNADFMAGNLNFNAPSADAAARIDNRGTITARDAGLVGLVAPQVSNSGVITARLGTVALASGNRFSVDLYGDGLMNIGLSDEVSSQLIEHKGTINAQGGTITLTAASGAAVVNSLINIEGELDAATISQKNGKIIIAADHSTVMHTGKMNASGTQAGSVSIRAKKMANQGTITADSSAGNGGSISITTAEAYLDSEASRTSATGVSGDGGSIDVIGSHGARAFVSGAYDVSSSTHTGGIAQITAEGGDLKLFGARVNADGRTGGGTINIGGEYQGRGTLGHAATTGINFATYLSANALDTGNGGNVIVWSDETTKFGGHAFAMGGTTSGNGGLIELSSKNELLIAGNAETNASAINGAAGRLLLDPKNITIATGGISGGISSFEFVDPNVDAGSFGGTWSGGVAVEALSTGNVVVRDYLDDFAAADAGAVYLYNGATGALISTITGSQNDDRVGYNLTSLSNGNFVIASPFWSNGGAATAGAATWASGTTGISGVVSAANSIVGSQTNDQVGTYITWMTNGNYLVGSPWWANGGINFAGAMTWGNGLGGTVGAVSAANSIVGSSVLDGVGNSVTILSNNNYVVIAPDWDNGGTADVGAVRWARSDGTTVGVITSANALIGSTTGDAIGNYGITPLTNGNYVVNSPLWDNGGVAEAGAVTWGNGTTGVTGVVSAANSLVGTAFEDYLGIGLVQGLANGNYIVSSYYWANGGASKAGAATWGNGTTGISGTISAANSLVGTTANDQVGYSITQLSNGNYIASSFTWDNGGLVDAGAVTWANGATGIVGAVSAANSLVGSSGDDRVFAQGLSNGNYVIVSPFWDNGPTVDVGAVTWANGTTGLVGTINPATSIIGATAGDQIGNIGITELTNGNYVIQSQFWQNGGLSQAGAATWASGVGVTSGVVSAANSLVGSSAFDNVGYVTPLSNGNYVAVSREWDNGGAVDAGAVTWGNGLGGTAGVISAANSLVGTSAGDNVGHGISILQNGNYVTYTPYWDNGGTADVGAVTWGNGLGGTVGAVSAANSLIGVADNDRIGFYGILTLTNSNYVVQSPYWDNGAISDAGAVTWGNGLGGTVGAVSAANSLVGSSASDELGTYVEILPNGNYVVYGWTWDNGGLVDAGAVTLGNGLSGTAGVINSSNSILGITANGGLVGAPYDAANGRVVFAFAAGQKAYSLNASFPSLGSLDSYGDQSTSSVTLAPSFITATLNLGTAVTLQASNDITVSNDIIANNGSGNGGALTLQAGRSILINADITTDNGDLNLFANERLATGVVNAQRDAGAAVITMGAGADINAGTGNVTIRLDDGAGKTNLTAGNISLRNITAGTILARNNNTTGDIILNSGSLIANAASGNSIILSSLRNFINNAGVGALNVGGTARWLVYSTNPADDTLGGLTASFRRFSCTYGGSCPTLGTGNGFLYSMTPTLTATANALAGITYGDAVPSLTGYAYTLSGYLGADGAADNVTGSLTGSTTYTMGSNAGTYNLNYASGSLASDMGYGFTYANNATALSVAKKNLTATWIAPLTKTYGNANPTVDYTNFNFTGLVGADNASLFGSITPNFGAVDANTGIGSYAVNAAIAATTNYTVTAPAATTLTIGARALNVITDAKSKIFGAADPVFTGSDNLTAHDAGLISWLYAPTGYAGAVGTYSITATATDVGSRLANYTRTNSYGNFTVTSAAPPPPTAGGGSTDLPSTFVYVSQHADRSIASAYSTSNTTNPEQVTNHVGYLLQTTDGATDTFSLFNGWITISPDLAQILGLTDTKV